MAEEVDVVGENGVALYAILKKEAHDKGLLHKTIVSQVIDAKGNWLLVKQAGDRQDPGQYVSPVGGHVKAGESDDHALIRETKEELGFVGDFKFEFVNRVVYNRYVLGRQENHLFILYKIYSDQKPKLNKESDSFKLFPRKELDAELENNPGQFGKPFIFIQKFIN